MAERRRIIHISIASMMLRYMDPLWDMWSGDGVTYERWLWIWNLERQRIYQKQISPQPSPGLRGIFARILSARIPDPDPSFEKEERETRKARFRENKMLVENLKINFSLFLLDFYCFVWMQTEVKGNVEVIVDYRIDREIKKKERDKEKRERDKERRFN